MISAINITGSRIPYQMQTLTANDLASHASSTQQASDPDNGDYKISLNRQINRLEHEQDSRETDLKQQHETEVKQLDREYNQQQRKIDQEYKAKKNVLKVNIYA